jgi:hypothetical protein
MSEKFDFESALKAIQSGQLITRKGVLTPLVRQLTEAALEGEPDSQFPRSRPSSSAKMTGRFTSSLPVPGHATGCLPKHYRRLVRISRKSRI